MSNDSSGFGFQPKSSPDTPLTIDQLEREITDDMAEHRNIMKSFDVAMNNFASERSLDSCIDALNASIQLANIRHRLLQSYKHYSQLLETEVVRISRKKNGTLE